MGIVTAGNAYDIGVVIITAEVETLFLWRRGMVVAYLPNILPV
jgi:hypothetical protein